MVQHVYAYHMYGPSKKYYLSSEDLNISFLHRICWGTLNINKDLNIEHQRNSDLSFIEEKRHKCKLGPQNITAKTDLPLKGNLQNHPPDISLK